MQIPILFKKIIENTFYDKETFIFYPHEEVGEEMDVMLTAGEMKEQLKCNIHQIGNEIVQQDYGLDIEANIMITCSKTIAQKGDLLEYGNKLYIITEILKPDSHIKIFAKDFIELDTPFKVREINKLTVMDINLVPINQLSAKVIEVR